MSRDPLPTWADWSDAASALGLRMQGGELKGPCPSCGGDDRFHVRPGRGGAALVGCRGCIDDGKDGFGAVLKAAFPERMPPARTSELRRSTPPTRPKPAPAGEDRHTRIACGAVSDPTLAPDTPLHRRIWEAALPADSTPARVYLSGRMAWPPVGTGPDLPPSVRWLPADAATRPAKGWPGLPPGVAGAVVYAWRRIEGGDAAGDLAAVSLEALDAHGRRPDQSGAGDRWRRTIGRRGGAAFTARAGEPGDPVHLTEGEVDALALTLEPETGPGRILATGGAGAMLKVAAALGGTGSVTVHADDDKGGRSAVRRVAGTCPGLSVRWYARGEDPARTLEAQRSEWLAERAGMRMDSGEIREEADRNAWADYLLHLAKALEAT